jgi:hypothetical protein
VRRTSLFSGNVGVQRELPGAVGVQWELPGAMARRDQGLAPRFSPVILKSRPLLGTASSNCVPAEAVRGAELLVCTRQRTRQFPLRPYIPGDSRDAFRIAAAETYLWGRSRTLRGSCLPHVEGPLNAEVTCRMLVAFAQTERTLHGLRESGTTLVVVCRNGSCAGCQEGPSIVALRSMPEIPRPECTNPEGCRCCLRPATQEERT